MIEILEGFPDAVVAARAKGRITKDDYERVLVPAVKQTLERHRKIRFYYELGSDFTAIAAGAMWEDFLVGVEHLLRWERVAIVTDVSWIRNAVNVFRFLIPGVVQVFGNADASGARTWIAAGMTSPSAQPTDS